MGQLATSKFKLTDLKNMAAIFRLGSRQILNQILKHEKVGMLSLVRPVTLKAQPAPPVKPMGHDERNMKLGRPQSPHLTIYAPQVTSMFSLAHRTTGMILAGYTILFGAAAVILPESIPTYLDNLEQSNYTFLVAPVKLVLALPMSYHFWNGIRHLTWDMGLFLTIKEVYLTAYVVFGLTLASTVALMTL